MWSSKTLSCRRCGISCPRGSVAGSSKTPCGRGLRDCDRSKRLRLRRALGAAKGVGIRLRRSRRAGMGVRRLHPPAVKLGACTAETKSKDVKDIRDDKDLKDTKDDAKSGILLSLLSL